jgi:hypothetical protein
VEFCLEFYIKIKPIYRNQNNIPTLDILEIDSSVFKSVQISSIFCRFVQKIKKIGTHCVHVGSRKLDKK